MAKIVEKEHYKDIFKLLKEMRHTVDAIEKEQREETGEER